MDLQVWVEWAKSVFPSEYPAARYVESMEDKGVVKSAYNVLLSYGPDKDVDRVAYRMSAGLNGLGAYFREQGADQRAIVLFRAAYSVLSGSYPSGDMPAHMFKASKFSFANLRALGVDETDIVVLDEPPIVEDAPWSRLDEILSQYLRTDTTGGVAVDESVATDRRPAAEAMDAGTFLRGLFPSWSTTEPVARVLASLKAYVNIELGRSGIIERDLGQLFEEDCRVLASIFEESGVAARRVDLVNATRESRAMAFKVGGGDRARLFWLASALLNHELWQCEDGLATNQPQVQIDLLGYISCVLISHRYDDGDRDLLLDSAEAVVRIASNVTPVVLGRFVYMRNWVLAAVGTYLMLAGPNPSSPSDSYYDGRIQSDDAPAFRGLKRADREDWSEMLLSGWQAGPEAEGGCYALASVCGWDAARAGWMLRFIYQASSENAGDLSLDYWEKGLTDLLSRVDRVRVASNPWQGTADTALRGSLITSDSFGRLMVPSPVLRAAAAQGLAPGDVITVHGNLFRGRRVPTYLLSNRYGPFAILKIDDRDKITREVRNFDAYARRLHQSYRPSECVAHPMDMYLGEDGSPLRAIQTSYVFNEEDNPLTLREWISSTDESALVSDTVGRLSLVSLKPWLAHVRRDRIDLRAEYPVLRPAPVFDKQSPRNWAETEIARVVASGSDLGMELMKEKWIAPPIRCAGDLDRPANVLGVDRWIDPAWLASEVAELGTGELSWLLDSLSSGLRDFDTLLSLCHGDLHLDNILCTDVDAQKRPRTVLIDFESAHYGHVCKDLAMIEASALCQVFEWTDEEYESMLVWFSSSPLMSIGSDGLLAGEASELTGNLARTAGISARMRDIATGCSQEHWPIRPEEYLVALLGALLPMSRYSTMTTGQRQAALALSTIVATSLLARWESNHH
ncbi:phosphotransferase [Kribbella soli]|uniref:Aminoglycoside phosphotransferase domain-containing protein n=1 Tax=Kribbella soli TaxID=1124743 RepID=A0A4R0HTJ2_9ACTN|nr:phosphotransferase [Kribbella soli]TCC11189.1 hypothetical protein E0H45_07850 [Kribbella soli]